MASIINLSTDSYIDVKVGPSTDATLVSNSPYILTLKATPQQNLFSIHTDTIKIIVLNTPVSCASVTVSTIQGSVKNYQVPDAQAVSSLTPFIFSGGVSQTNAFPCFSVSLTDLAGNILSTLTP